MSIEVVFPVERFAAIAHGLCRFTMFSPRMTKKVFRIAILLPTTRFITTVAGMTSPEMVPVETISL